MTRVFEHPEALLAHAGEFGGSNPDDHRIRAQSCYHVIFATLARQLSLGTGVEAVHAYDWNRMKHELARMSLAYLRADDRPSHGGQTGVSGAGLTSG